MVDNSSNNNNNNNNNQHDIESLFSDLDDLEYSNTTKHLVLIHPHMFLEQEQDKLVSSLGEEMGSGWESASGMTDAEFKEWDTMLGLTDDSTYMNMMMDIKQEEQDHDFEVPVPDMEWLYTEQQPTQQDIVDITPIRTLVHEEGSCSTITITDSTRSRSASASGSTSQHLDESKKHYTANMFDNDWILQPSPTSNNNYLKPQTITHVSSQVRLISPVEETNDDTLSHMSAEDKNGDDHVDSNDEHHDNDHTDTSPSPPFRTAAKNREGLPSLVEVERAWNIARKEAQELVNAKRRKRAEQNNNLKVQPADMKNQKRLQKNRDSAFTSRIRRRRYTELLEEGIERHAKETEKMKLRLESLQKDRQALFSELDALLESCPDRSVSGTSAADSSAISQKEREEDIYAFIKPSLGKDLFAPISDAFVGASSSAAESSSTAAIAVASVSSSKAAASSSIIAPPVTIVQIVNNVITPISNPNPFSYSSTNNKRGYITMFAFIFFMGLCIPGIRNMDAVDYTYHSSANCQSGSCSNELAPTGTSTIIFNAVNALSYFASPQILPVSTEKIPVEYNSNDNNNLVDLSNILSRFNSNSDDTYMRMTSDKEAISIWDSMHGDEIFSFFISKLPLSFVMEMLYCISSRFKSIELEL